jgi:hypothetical protein
MKSFKFEYKREDLDSVIGFLIIIMILIIINYLNNSFEKNQKEIVLTSSTGEVVLIESKSFLGGVWFNKDRLDILYDKFDIEKNSFISGKEKVQLPFSVIKKVNFEKKFYDIYKISIKSEFGSFTFFIQNKNNFEIVKNKIIEMCRDRFVIEYSTD